MLSVSSLLCVCLCRVPAFIVLIGEQSLLELAKSYQKAVQDEDKTTPEKQAIANVGKLDPKRHLEVDVQTLMGSNILQTLSAMLDTVVF